MLRFTRVMLAASAVTATVALVAWGASGGALGDEPSLTTTMLQEFAPDTDIERDLLLDLLPMLPAGKQAAFAAPALPMSGVDSARHLGGHGDGTCPLGPDLI
jgi:hypothetical protein